MFSAETFKRKVCFFSDEVVHQSCLYFWNMHELRRDESLSVFHSWGFTFVEIRKEYPQEDASGKIQGRNPCVTVPSLWDNQCNSFIWQGCVIVGKLIFSAFSLTWQLQSIGYDTRAVPADKLRNCFDDLLCKEKWDLSARLCAACLWGNSIKGTGTNRFQCRLAQDN